MGKTHSPRHAYYYTRQNRALSFLVPPGKTILYFGKVIPGVLPNLQPTRCLAVHDHIPTEVMRNGSASVEFLDFLPDEYIPEEKFDYIIFNETIGESRDICRLFYNVQKACRSSTRIVIIQHNYLWQRILSVAGKLSLKEKEKTQNWISISDLKNYLNTTGYECVRSFRNTICPVKLFCLGPFANWLTELLPFFDFFKLEQYILARPARESLPAEGGMGGSLTICITVRNEKKNIEPIVASLPKVANEQEILFVEGHSSDGTREEIERTAALYPEKKIRVIGQPGIGQGDAIRVGFKEALGDIIILYEGDGTSDPDNIRYFYKAVRSGRYEFLEGSRFVYPFEGHPMPFFNKIGNIFFAKWFSWILGQNVTDVLSGIKAISRQEYETVYDNWGFLGVEDPFGDFELLYGALRFGLKTGEIPMHYKQRYYGESKTRFLQHGFILVKMAWRGYRIFRSLNYKEKI